ARRNGDAVAREPAWRQGRRRGRGDRLDRGRRERRDRCPVAARNPPPRHAVHRPDCLAGDPGGEKRESRRRGCGRQHERLEREGRPGMIPAAFEYTRPTSLDEAIAAIGSGGKIIAGGHSLLPLLKLRLAQADTLVDIGRLSELKGYRATPDGGVEIGALTTYAEW